MANILGDESDFTKAETEYNTTKIKEIQDSWLTASEPLLVPKRLYVREGMLSKMCRKGLKPRYFFLFNDILIYGTIVAKNKYSKQHLLRLKDMSITDIGNDIENHGIQINHKAKSFHVFADSKLDKEMWLKVLAEYIEKQSGRKAHEEVAARAVWIPDSQVKKCMACNEREFGVLVRKHHCRSCGKVVCGTCSSHKVVLYNSKPERVCDVCFADINLSGAPPKRTDSFAMSGVGLAKRKPAPPPNSSSSEAEEQKASASDSSDSESDDENDEQIGEEEQPVVALPKPKPSNPADRKSFTEAEKKLHQMSNEERLLLLQSVRDGKYSMEQVLIMIDEGKNPLVNNEESTTQQDSTTVDDTTDSTSNKDSTSVKIEEEPSETTKSPVPKPRPSKKAAPPKPPPYQPAQTAAASEQQDETSTENATTESEVSNTLSASKPIKPTRSRKRKQFKSSAPSSTPVEVSQPSEVGEETDAEKTPDQTSESVETPKQPATPVETPKQPATSVETPEKPSEIPEQTEKTGSTQDTAESLESQEAHAADPTAQPSKVPKPARSRKRKQFKPAAPALRTSDLEVLQQAEQLSEKADAILDSQGANQELSVQDEDP